MIRVTIWNEHFQDRGIELAAAAEREGKDAQEVERLRKMGEAVRAVHPEGINETLKTIFARMVTPSGWSLPLAVAPRQRWSLRPTDAAATLIIYTIVKTPGFGAEPQGRWGI